MKKENSTKNKSGNNSKKVCEDMLNELKNNEKINVDYEKNYSIGYPDKYKQYKMDYKVMFDEQETWLVKVTSSIRSDRMYGVEYFSQNIRAVDKTVKEIYVCIPDSAPEKEIHEKDRYNKNIQDDKFVSFISDIITISELKTLIMDKGLAGTSKGIESNIRGKEAEVSLVRIFTNSDNLKLWNDYEKEFYTVKSNDFPIFKAIVSKLGLNMGVDKLESINATDKIPKLSNNGYPKTDVIFGLKIQNEIDKKEYSVSIKETSKKIVTVHEGDVSDVIKALNIDDNSLLATALYEFQKSGSKKNLDDQYCDILTNELPAYSKKMIEFFLFGVNSPLVINEKQVADYILYTHNFLFESRDNYVNSYLTQFQNKGQFGTPFKWTYPSGKRGQKIQIKAYTNN